MYYHITQVKLQNELTKLAPGFGAKTILTLTVPNVEAQGTWQAKACNLYRIIKYIKNLLLQLNGEIYSLKLQVLIKSIKILSSEVNPEVPLGFHSHNNGFSFEDKRAYLNNNTVTAFDFPNNIFYNYNVGEMFAAKLDGVPIFNISDTLVFIKQENGLKKLSFISTNKIKNNLNWFPEVSFEQGLDKTIDWYIQNSNWIDNIIKGTYKNYNK